MVGLAFRDLPKGRSGWRAYLLEIPFVKVWVESGLQFGKGEIDGTWDRSESYLVWFSDVDNQNILFTFISECTTALHDISAGHTSLGCWVIGLSSSYEITGCLAHALLSVDLYRWPSETEI